MMNSMEKIKMRPYDGVGVSCFLILPGLFYTGLSNLVEKNNTAAWITLVVSFVLMLCLFLITVSLMKRYEGKNIIEVTGILMGRPVAVLYGFSLGAYFCYYTGIYVREAAEILKVYGFNLTSIYIVAGLIILSAVVMNLFGGWAIIKSASFFFVLILFCIIFVLLLGVNRYNPDHLVPAFGNGVQDIAKNSLYLTSMFDRVIILALFAPAFKNNGSLRKTGIISLLAATAASVLLCLCCVMMFSQSVASTLVSGFMEMGKSSYYNHFFYRFESILLFFLIFSAVISASLGLMIARESIAGSFNFKSSKGIVGICAVGIIISDFIPISRIRRKTRF